MLTPESIRKQVATLTADLVGLGLCDHQNFPSLKDLGQGVHELGIRESASISFALKNVAYHDTYFELNRTGTYNLRMLDGALIQMMYRFRDNLIEAHRLAFFPSPALEEFQNNPEIYLTDEIYADVTMKNIVPFPLRFDFDCRAEVFVDQHHPKSHLTLGQYKNCRVPVSAPITPYFFIGFVLRNFYNTAFRKYCDKISSFPHCFDLTITNGEKDLLYMQVPNRRSP